MIRITRITTFPNRGAESASHVWRAVSSQPNWISRIALLAFFIIIGLPIVLLFVLAVLVSVAVFAVLAGAYSLYNLVRGSLPRSDGRENVVVRRVE